MATLKEYSTSLEMAEQLEVTYEAWKSHRRLPSHPSLSKFGRIVVYNTATTLAWAEKTGYGKFKGAK